MSTPANNRLTTPVAERFPGMRASQQAWLARLLECEYVHKGGTPCEVVVESAGWCSGMDVAFVSWIADHMVGVPRSHVVWMMDEHGVFVDNMTLVQRILGNAEIEYITRQGEVVLYNGSTLHVTTRDWQEFVGTTCVVTEEHKNGAALHTDTRGYTSPTWLSVVRVRHLHAKE